MKESEDFKYKKCNRFIVNGGKFEMKDYHSYS